MKTIAITGGIGAGKSVVSTVLRLMGYYVFDCDAEAKAIMDRSDAIKAQLVSQIHEKAVVDSVIDRRLIAAVVFNEAVRLRLSQVIAERSKTDSRIFVETAILYQSGLDRMVDEVWDVVAEDEVRIARVMKRNALSRGDVIARIESQRFIPDTLHPNVHEINNDGFTAVIPQILNLLR